MPVQVYFKDPDVAEAHEAAGIDREFTTPWEPGLWDGSTRARFAVVDYDSTSNTLTPPAVCLQCFVPNMLPIRLILKAIAL